MKSKDITFLEIRYLRGPNIWTYRPVIEAVVDIGELEDFPSNVIPGFNERLTALLITDSHGIQFLIRDRYALDAHSRRILDRFL